MTPRDRRSYGRVPLLIRSAFRHRSARAASADIPGLAPTDIASQALRTSPERAEHAHRPEAVSDALPSCELFVSGRSHATSGLAVGHEQPRSEEEQDRCEDEYERESAEAAEGETDST